MPSALQTRPPPHPSLDSLFVDEDPDFDERSFESFANDENDAANYKNDNNLSDDEEEYIDDEGVDDDAASVHSNEEPNNPCRSIKAPHQRLMKIGKILGLMQRQMIDLNPAYQRGEVWSSDRMGGLISSLFGNFFIPPIIFSVTPIKQEDGTVTIQRVCVDGKQRITSLMKFVQGKIAVTDRKGNKQFYCSQLDVSGREGRRRTNVLTESQRDYFRDREFVVFEYSELEQADEEDLFARVQLGMALNEPEKLRAHSCAWQQLTKQYCEDFPEVVALSHDRRASGFRNVLATFAQILDWKESANPKVRNTPAQLRNMLKKTQPSLTDKHHFKHVFETYSVLATKYPEIFSGIRYESRKTTQTFAPVEFAAVGVLISEYMDRRNTELLQGDINHLRDSLRVKLKDIRYNSFCWGVITKVIKDLPSFRGDIDTTLVRPDDINENSLLNQIERKDAAKGQARGRAKKITEASGLNPASPDTPPPNPQGLATRKTKTIARPQKAISGKVNSVQGNTAGGSNLPSPPRDTESPKRKRVNHELEDELTESDETPPPSPKKPRKTVTGNRPVARKSISPAASISPAVVVKSENEGNDRGISLPPPMEYIPNPRNTQLPAAKSGGVQNGRTVTSLNELHTQPTKTSRDETKIAAKNTHTQRYSASESVSVRRRIDLGQSSTTARDLKRQMM
ncbi:MAG: hypothetical protein M1829_000306 [Trizodia sp. TS-e1964]|nr:MAG: hypothetical protein M1829_000306 [Trizodia sp. TS-e1964]